MDNANEQHAVLIIDDEPFILKALERSLRNEGYSLYCVDNHSKALEMISTMKFAVVISDYTMPVMTGSEILSVVAIKDPKTIRIMLTGATKAQSVPESIADNILHCHKFITKPWDDVDLRKLIRQSIAEYEAADASGTPA